MFALDIICGHSDILVFQLFYESQITMEVHGVLMYLNIYCPTCLPPAMARESLAMQV